MNSANTGDWIKVKSIEGEVSGFVTGFGKKDGQRTVIFEAGDVRPVDGDKGNSWAFVLDIIEVKKRSSQLQELRRALRAVLGITGSCGKTAMEIRKNAYGSYINAFTKSEQAAVLTLAKKVQKDAPKGHGLATAPRITTYGQAVKQLGIQLIDEALGELA